MYKYEIRVVRIDEKDSYQAGKWAHYKNCFSLEPGDTLVATSGFVDASTLERQIPRGSRWTFTGLDEDGDVRISCSPPLNGCSEMVIFMSDLRHMSLQ